MGGKATFSGTDFQARAGAYFAAQIIARSPMPPFDLPRSVPVCIAFEQGGPGDDIRLTGADERVYEVQAKHGLKADKRLSEAMANFAARLQPDEYGVLLIDPTASAPVRNDLPKVFTYWRNGQEPKLSATLGKCLEPLLDDACVELRCRIAVVALDLEAEHSGHVREAVLLLRQSLVEQSRSGHAWSHLIRIVGTASKEQHEYRRERLLELLAFEDCVIAGDERVDLAPAATREALAIQSADQPFSHVRMIASLIEKVQPRAALVALDGLASKPAKNESEEAELLTLRALAHLQLDDGSAAYELLESALKHDPRYVPALLNLANSEFARGNESRAKELLGAAVQIEPENARVWAVRVQLRDVAFADVPEALRSDGRLAKSAAVAAIERGDPAAAVAVFDSDQETKLDPEGSHLLAVALVQFAERQPARALPFLERALGLLNTVLVAVPEAGVSLHRAALHNRALVLERLGRTTDALADLRVLAAAEGSPDALGAYARLALECRREMDGALNALERSGSILPDGGTFRVRLLNALGRPSEAKRALQDLVADLADRDDDALVTIAAAAIELDDAAVAHRVLEMLPADSKHTGAAVMRARLAVLEGDPRTAGRHYACALDLAAAEHQQSLRMELASFLRRQSKVREALDVLEPVLVAGDDMISRMGAELLYALGQFSRSEALAAAAPESSAWAARVLAFIAVRRFDHNGAEGHFRRWKKLSPDAREPVLYAAELCVQQQRFADAKQWLVQLSLTELTAFDRVRLASLYLRAGEAQYADELGWSALRDAHDDDMVLSAYVQLATSAMPREQKNAPDVVVPEMAVRLQMDSGEDRTYLLTAQTPIKTPLRELSIGDPIAQNLLGRRVGDEIMFHAAPLAEKARVVEVISKEAHAFRWAAAELERRAPSSNTLRSFSVASEDGGTNVAPFLEIARVHATREKEILDLTNERILPLGFAAKALGRSLLEVYASIANDAERLLFAEELDVDAAVRACRSPRVVLTGSALLTFTQLRALSLLQELPGKLLVTPQLLVVLKREQEEQEEVARHGRLGMGGDGRGLVLVATPKHVGRERAYALQELRDWVQQRCEVVLPDRPLDRAEGWDAIDDESEQAVMLARMQEAALLCDDLGLRRLARAAGTVPGASSYAVLLSLRESNAISEEELAAHVRMLLQLGHAAIPLSVSDAIVTISTQNNPTTMAVFARMMQHVRAPWIEAVQACWFVARVLCAVALQSALSELLPSAADTCFEILLSNQPAQQREAMVASLRIALEDQFDLLPAHGQRLRDQLDAFVQRTRC